MKAATVLRIFRKDVRHFWPLAGIYWALQALAAMLPFHPDRPSTGIPLQDAVETLRWLALGLLAVLIMQDDGPDGRRAAWFSRPIGNADVLAAKLALIAAIGVMPVIVAAACQGLALGIAGREIARAALALAAMNAMIALLAALLGSITRGMVQALGTALGVGIAGSTMGHWLEHHLNALMIDRPAAFGIWMESPDNKAGYHFLVYGMLISAPLLVWLAYRTRRSVSTLLVIAIVVIAVFQGSFIYPLIVVRPQPAPPPQPRPLAQLTLAAPRLSVLQTAYDTGAGQEMYFLGVQVHLTLRRDKPRPWASMSQARFVTNDGETFAMPRPLWIENSLSGSTTKQVLGPKPLRWDLIAAPLGGTLPPIPAGFKDGVLNLISIPKPVADRLRGKKGHLDAWVSITRGDLGLTGEAPLRPGAEVRDRDSRWRVRSVLLLPDGIATLGIDSARFTADVPFNGAGGRFVLVNRARNEVSMPRADFYSSGVHSFSAVQGGHTTVPFREVFSLRTREEKGRITADWLKDAHLAVLEYVGGESEREHVDLGEVEMPASF